MYLLEEDFIKLTSLYNSLLNLLKKEFINNYEITIANAISYIHNFYLQLQVKSLDTFIPPSKRWYPKFIWFSNMSIHKYSFIRFSKYIRIKPYYSVYLY